MPVDAAMNCLSLSDSVAALSPEAVASPVGSVHMQHMRDTRSSVKPSINQCTGNCLQCFDTTDCEEKEYPAEEEYPALKN